MKKNNKTDFKEDRRRILGFKEYSDFFVVSAMQFFVSG